jgi:FKBP-type peptidyl-prolyl cis-trans isomerase FkpA
MKLKLPLIAAFVALTSLAACGGGGSDSPTSEFPVESPAALVKTDASIGAGAEAVSGKAVKLHYTGWLYSSTATGFKGAQFDSSVGKTPLAFTLGTNAVVPGFEQGVLGMKVGGKRTVLIPSALGYGAAGRGSIPPNSGIVFDIELLEVK